MSPRITRHAALRFLERKCGIKPKNITKELIATATKELAAYFKTAEEIPIFVPGGMKVYADNARGLRFFCRGGAMVTVTTDDYSLVKKRKTPFVNRVR